jgi:GDPmannose 4,6-dehydratase
MEAAWQMLQLETPDDFIIATGEAHSVKEWADEAFAVAKLQPENHVMTDPSLLRPTKTGALVGDIGKAQKVFGFKPKIKFKELVRMMVDADLRIEQSTRDSY